MMKNLQKLLLTALFAAAINSLVAQTWTMTSTPNSTQDVRSLAAKGSMLYAAVGTAGVYSSPDGTNWTQLTTLPTTGMWGTAQAEKILIGGNGDILVAASDRHSMGVMGAVFYRSANNGTTWTQVGINGTGGYEEPREMAELTDGTLFVRVANARLFRLAPGETLWTEITIPYGSNITMLQAKADTLFITTNFTTLSYSADKGASWSLYPKNETDLSISGPITNHMLVTSTNKFIGYGSAGIFRSGLNDTLWQHKNSGLPNTIYTTALATDGQSIWIGYQVQGSGGNNCYSGVSSDNGDTWTIYPGNTPTNPTNPPCLRTIVPFGADVYSFAGKDIYKISDVATQLPTGTSGNHESVTFSIFPNPASQLLTLQLPENTAANTVKITDTKGIMTVQKELNGESKNTINVSSLKKGIYQVTIEGNGQSYSTRLVIE